ncbi:MAG: mechanosensitive ion channel [bacterium]|nr:mechanosensitive ion channel [bacterium]
MTDRKASVRKLLISLLLLAALAVPFAFWTNLWLWLGIDVLPRSIEALRYLIAVLIWLLLAHVINRAITVIIWDGIFEARMGKPIPKLIRNVASVIIYAAALAGIIGVVFDQSLTVFFAATGGAGLVIGLAVQTLIADFFSGLVISLQRPFRIGDYIEIEGDRGTVMEVNWRATQILTSLNRLVTFPNNKVAGATIINYTHAEPLRFAFWITLDYGVPVERAERILLAAARSGQHDAGGKQPSVEALKVDENGISYRIRFWVPDPSVWYTAQAKMIGSIQHHLQIAGIRYSRWLHQQPSSDVEYREVDYRSQKLTLLHKVGLFDSLTSEQLDFLESRMTQRNFAPGEEVVVQGSAGDSMFVIAEGLLDVFVFFEDEGKEVRVAQIQAGSFLGEISLLTGEPRTATVRASSECVLFEITHHTMKRLFELRPSLVEELTEVMAQRKLNDLLAKENLPREEAEAQKATIAEQFLGRIKGFFKIGG